MSRHRQGDLELYYEVHGDDSLQALMLLHGSTASSAVFSALVPNLTAKRQVILVDLLGHGRSDRYRQLPRHVWEANALAIRGLLESLSLDRLDILGVSGGAIVAINLALIDPGRVRRLVADSFFGSKITREEAVSLAAGREQAMEEPELARFWRSLHGGDWREVVNNDTIAITEAARRGLPLYVRNPEELTSPALITGTREDDLIPNAEVRLRAFAGRLPAAETIIFERGGHPAMFSNATPFLAALEGFLGLP